jgi:hypothetical protein
MYGKFMAGLDIDALYTQIYNDTVDSPVTSSLIAAEADILDDDIVASSVPRMQAGMRDINSVISSSFAVGRSIIEDTRTKVVAKFSAELKYRLLPIAQEKWRIHLDWNKNVVATYAEIIKFYFLSRIDADEINYAMAAKDRLWPFTVLDFERAALGSLQGATNSKTDVAGASTAARALSGALSGAAMGAMIGSYWNTAATTTTSSAGTVTTAGSSAGSMYGAGVGAVLGAAAALTY